MNPYLASRVALRRETALRLLGALEVGETLQISAFELDDYTHAREQLPDREFTRRKGRDDMREWFVLRRTG